MTSLLPDLYAEITSHCTRGTLFQLCGCSRAWYSVAALQLYSTVSGELDAAAFLRTIATNEWLGSKVRFLTIHWDSDEAHLFAPALRNMPNLEHLRAYNLARACEADQACVDTLLSLKNLQSISWCWCESFDLDEVLDRLPPLHRIAWEWDGHPSRALDRLVARSHAVLQTLKLEDYPLEDVVNRLANSVVFSQLTTIDMFKISLGTLTGGRFPALRKIKSQYITDLGLLRDSAFLPMLRSVRLACNYGLEDTMGLPDSDSSGHSRTPLRSDRHLSFLKLDTSDINPAIAGAADLAGPGDEAINKFGLYLEPFNLSKLSSLSLFFDTPDQIELVMGFLGGILADEHALRVLAVQLGRHDDSFASMMRCLCELAAKHLLQRLRYLRVTMPIRSDALREQMGLALSFMPLVTIAHFEYAEGEEVYAWTRSGGGWGERMEVQRPHWTMPWPYSVLGLEGEELLEYIDSKAALI